MSRQLPVPISNLPDRSADLIVLETPRVTDRPGAVAKALLSMTPDVLRFVERSLASRRSVPALPIAMPERRTQTRGLHLSEVEIDTSVPFLRKVTVRKATAWGIDAPEPEIIPAPRSLVGRRTKLLGVSGALVLAAVGVIANRSTLPVVGRGR